MLMASKETGILRANICRYVATLRESDKIAEVKKSLCKNLKPQSGLFIHRPQPVPEVEPV